MHRLLLSILILLCAASCQSPSAPAARPLITDPSRVLVMVAEGFNRGEFWDPYRALTAAGYRVDIAGPARGIIACNPGKPGPNDTTATLSLGEVNTADYAALVIPGGYSPGNLEKYARSIAICREFAEHKKLIAAICHGPRLLARANLLRGRVATCYYEVANELPDQWVDGSFGHYVDQAVVHDGQLLTSRYPGDSTNFACAIVNALHANGGPPLVPSTQPVATQPAVIPTVALSVDGGFDDRAFAAVDALLRAKGEVVQLVSKTGGFQHGKEGMVVLTIAAPGAADKARYHISASGVSSVTSRADPEVMRVIARGKPGADSATRPVSYIALGEGFDGRTAAAMDALLRFRGHRVVLVAARRGPQKSLEGLTFEAETTYDDLPEVSPDSVIVLPGGFYPRKDTNARQSQQPAWIEQQAARDTARIAWVFNRHDAGAAVLTFGLDGLRLGVYPRFAGKELATCEQAMWSFGKTGGKYSPRNAVGTAPRLVSARSIEFLGEALQLLQQQSVIKTGGPP